MMNARLWIIKTLKAGKITDTNLQHGPMPYEQILLDIQHYIKYCVKTNQSGS